MWGNRVKTIQVSSAVFAAIWRARREGEENENVVLRRLLGVKEEDSVPPPPGGFLDERSGVHFPEGTEIRRTFRGHPFTARAERGRWFVRASGKTYRSLHELTKSVNPDGTENAWLTWKYEDRVTHEFRYIDQLRKQPKEQ
jgi:hypothetical protein